MVNNRKVGKLEAAYCACGIWVGLLGVNRIYESFLTPFRGQIEIAYQEDKINNDSHVLLVTSIALTRAVGVVAGGVFMGNVGRERGRREDELIEQEREKARGL